MAAKLAKATSYRDRTLREGRAGRRYTCHNTSGKNQYAERRSHINDETKKWKLGLRPN